MNSICQKVLKDILHYNPLTGIFTWKAKIAGKVSIGQRAGSLNKESGYRFIRIFNKRYREHRLAFLYMQGFMPEQVDHLNHKRDDNSWKNLQESNSTDNGKNHPRTKRNATGVVGVSLREDGKYIARIYVNKKHVFLGVFCDSASAKEARLRANKLHGFKDTHGT